MLESRKIRDSSHDRILLLSNYENRWTVALFSSFSTYLADLLRSLSSNSMKKIFQAFPIYKEASLVPNLQSAVSKDAPGALGAAGVHTPRDVGFGRAHGAAPDAQLRPLHDRGHSSDWEPVRFPPQGIGNLRRTCKVGEQYLNVKRRPAFLCFPALAVRDLKGSFQWNFFPRLSRSKGKRKPDRRPYFVGSFPAWP